MRISFLIKLRPCQGINYPRRFASVRAQMGTRFDKLTDRPLSPPKGSKAAEVNRR